MWEKKSEGNTHGVDRLERGVGFRTGGASLLEWWLYWGDLEKQNVVKGVGICV